MSEVRLWAIRLTMQECITDMRAYPGTTNQGKFARESKLGRLVNATPYMGVNPDAARNSVFVLYRSPEEAEKAFHIAEKIFNFVQIVKNPAYVDRKYLKKKH